MSQDKKNKILTLGVVVVLGFIAIGISFAFLTGRDAIDTDFRTSVSTNTTDSLIFNVDTDISIVADMSNFTEGKGNREGVSNATATLKANNKTNNATGNYYLYFNIKENEFNYTTETKTAELLLQVTGPDGVVTTLDGLNYVTVTDGNGESISGFDITTKHSLITIVNNKEITTTSEKAETFEIKVIFVNLNEDQTANGGHKFNGNLIIQKEMLGGTIKSIDSSYTGEIWGHKDSIKKIVFENKLEPHNNATYTYNIADTNSKDVMAYMIDNGDNTYTTYIQSDTFINANENSSFLFSNFSNLETIEGMKYFNTSNSIDLSYMFFNCTNLENIDVSNFNTSKVINMNYLFRNCSNIITLDVSGWDTANVTSMETMFTGCVKLQSLDLVNWDTKNVTSIALMFGNCTELQSLNISKWDTSNITNMSMLFRDCSNLQNLDLSGWDTSKVLDTNYIFYGCSSLSNIDLRNATFTSVTNSSQMFVGIKTDVNIIIKDNDAKVFIEARLGSGKGTVTIA